MTTEQKLQTFVTMVKLPQPIFHIERGYESKSLRCRPAHQGYTLVADLNDPVNHLFAAALKMQYNGVIRRYEINKRQTLQVAYQIVADRLTGEISRVAGRKQPLTFWCRHYINNMISSDSNREVAETLMQIYLFVAPHQKSSLDHFSVETAKVPQFIALMTALKIKLTKEKGWNREEDPDKNRYRGRRRRRR